MKTVLDVQDLKTYFFVREGVVKALDGVSFSMLEGDSLGLVGESGCGKSVTARSIMRLIPDPGKIVGGKVMFEGENLLEKSDDEMRRIRGSKIAMVFQNPSTSLNPVYTVGFQISEAIGLHQKKKGKELWNASIDILNKVGVADTEKRLRDYPHQFSGGMKQRAMIAMALSCRPALLIADEPTTALDVTTQAQILELLNELKKQLGAALLYITHDLGVMARVCEKVAVMYAGKVVEYGDVESIFSEPKHPYTQLLLKSIPRAHSDVERLEVIKGAVPDMLNPPSGCKFHPRCPFVLDICAKDEPPAYPIKGDRLVRCFLYDEKRGE